MLKPLTVWITTNCEKFLKRWESQITVSVSWETCMQVKKQQNPTWNKGLVQIGKGVHQVCILLSCLFNLYAEYIIWNARLDESQAGIKIAERNIYSLRYADDTTLMAESKEELKSFLNSVGKESTCNAGDPGSIPGSGSSPEEGIGYPLQ